MRIGEEELGGGEEIKKSEGVRGEVVKEADSC